MATDSSSSSSRPVRAEGSKTLNQADRVEGIRQQVAWLRFGVIPIVVHESRVVPIDRTGEIRVKSENRSRL